MSSEFIDFTVAEPGYVPASGRYMGTRRKDGFVLAEIKGRTGKMRKFVNPIYLKNMRDDIDIRMIDRMRDV